MEYKNSAPRFIRAPMSPHGILLFVLPLPLFLVIAKNVFAGNFSDLLPSVVAAVLYFYGAWFVRRGTSIEREYNKRKVSIPPTLPRKFLGSVLFGVASYLVANFVWNQDLLFSILIGIGAWFGVVLAYGTDPRKEKGIQGVIDGYTTQDVIAALEQAEAKIVDIEDARRAISNLSMKKHLHTITGQAREILGIIEEDPSDLRRARRFLNVYLDSAKRITTGYVKATKHGTTEELDKNLEDLLIQMEQTFAEQKQHLIDNDQLDVDVQIEVLKTRLEKEGF